MALYDSRQELPLLTAGKPLAMLTYLCLAGRNGCSREDLAELLWSGVDAERGMASVRQSIFVLRHTVDSRLLQQIGSRISVNLPITVDAEQFADACDREDLATAIASYTGPFLDGAILPG